MNDYMLIMALSGFVRSIKIQIGIHEFANDSYMSLYTSQAKGGGSESECS